MPIILIYSPLLSVIFHNYTSDFLYNIFNYCPFSHLNVHKKIDCAESTQSI